MSYECEPRPSCPACGATWNDEMVALFDVAMGIGCACCNPFGAEIPDIVCHACRKVLYSQREGAAATPSAEPDLDLSPKS